MVEKGRNLTAGLWLNAFKQDRIAPNYHQIISVHPENLNVDSFRNI